MGRAAQTAQRGTAAWTPNPLRSESCVFARARLAHGEKGRGTMREVHIESGPRVRVAPAALASLVTLAVTGCYQGGDASKPRKVDTSLAALMADGPLPATMQGSSEPIPPEPPPRFCNFREPDGGIEDDA